MIESVTKKVDEDLKTVSFEKNKYVRYTENGDYIMIRPLTCRTAEEKVIFDRMVKAGGDLKDLFPPLRGMTSKVIIRGKPKNLKGDMELVGNDLIRTSAIFDGGSDIACHTSDLAESIEFKDQAPILVRRC